MIISFFYGQLVMVCRMDGKEARQQAGETEDSSNCLCERLLNYKQLAREIQEEL